MKGKAFRYTNVRLEQPLLHRLFTRRVGAMLVRNTVVSCLVFGISLFSLWALVTFAGTGHMVAAGTGFIAANTLHYSFGRLWIFKGTDRGVKTGYLLFLVNAGVGLAVTLTLYALFLEFTAMNYLVARTIVSVFAGLTVFVLNAVWNFRRV